MIKFNVNMHNPYSNNSRKQKHSHQTFYFTELQCKNYFLLTTFHIYKKERKKA